MTCLSALQRRDCPVCGPSSLFDGLRCVTCGRELKDKKPRLKRLPKSVAVEAARAQRKQRMALPTYSGRVAK
jgi:uncharacterized membrane protein YvbJ